MRFVVPPRATPGWSHEKIAEYGVVAVGEKNCVILVASVTDADAPPKEKRP